MELVGIQAQDQSVNFAGRTIVSGSNEIHRGNPQQGLMESLMEDSCGVGETCLCLEW